MTYVLQNRFVAQQTPTYLPFFITTTSLPSGTQGVAYSTQLAATGGLGPYTFSILSGSLDSGLSLSSAGIISGTPANVETDTIAFLAKDNAGNTASKVLSLTVAPANPLQITTTSPLPGATQSAAYSDTMAATGGVPPYTWSLVSSTGTNTWSVSSSGVVTGTPATAETDSLVIKVTDSVAASAQGTFSLAVSAASSSFFADPYSSYTSYIADTTFAGTNGTTTTVAWNNGTLTAPTYNSPQAAINAAAAVNGGAGQRVCLLAGQTWTYAFQSPWLIPSISATSTNRFVIQGDPAASAATMPIATGNGTEGYGLVVGGPPPFTGAAARSVTNPNVTIRKVEITNFVGVSNSVGAINLTANNYNGFVAEYCKLHLFRQVVGPGGGGPVYTNTPNDTATFEIRYCKMYDNLMTDGTTQGRPFAAVETYGGVFSIHHNESYAINTFYAGKVLTPTTPNGSIAKNLVHDIPDMIEFEAGGEGLGINVITVTGNLFYWTNFNNTVFGTPGNATVYNDFGANGNTTAPTGMQFSNNTVDPAIGNASNPAFWNHTTTAVQFHDNIYLGSVPLMVQSGGAGTWTVVDRNFYFNPATFYLNGSGSPASVGSFTAWQSAHTTFPTFGGLTANPDPNGGNIGAFASPWNTIAANFPNNASHDFTIAAGSPLKGAGTAGADPGYNSADCGPGW